MYVCMYMYTHAYIHTPTIVFINVSVCFPPPHDAFQIKGPLMHLLPPIIKVNKLSTHEAIHLPYRAAGLLQILLLMSSASKHRTDFSCVQYIIHLSFLWSLENLGCSGPYHIHN